ncbi:MAG: hypothetical protein IMY71_15160 [Bacteroidetes bacterium]|nr:hypothetical protein [Bacteroidota bacterium]
MKTKSVLLIIVTVFFVTVFSNKNFAQESIDQKAKMLDLKLQLLDSKLELLDSKIKIWESKPAELDIRLDEIDDKIKTLNFDPAGINLKFLEVDSMIQELKEVNIPVIMPVPAIQEQEIEFYKDYKSAIMLNPVSLFEGTLHLSYERLLTDKFSVSISALATYATEQGMSQYFFKNQRFEYLSASSNSYEIYQGESIAGTGIVLQGKNYLMANFKTKNKAPLGLYAAPQLMYRRIWITGEAMEYIEDDNEWVEKEITQRLNICSAGVVIGTKIPVMKVLLVDIFVGGNIRLSKYDEESGLTKYKKWYNIDYSGVFPTAGIGIGILK